MVQCKGNLMRQRRAATKLHPTVSRISVPFEDEVNTSSSKNVRIKGSEESSALEPRGTQDKATGNNNRKKRIKLPASLEKKEWYVYEEEIDMVLGTAFAGPLDGKLAVMATIMHSMGLCRFGAQQKRAARTTPILNQHKHKINQLRGDIQRLTLRTLQKRDQHLPS
ncbi:hypothetical protein DPMN_010262 [Dreissena polymorpha]|uniref:Uncharacterized protein n=1 Tax=Dreissena polymorpha TaxID=45954 RepID=A0A9D4S0T7_DREPO|nr:hypothetical protein DPMN_010262 [Dreissena polymorpha]